VNTLKTLLVACLALPLCAAAQAPTPVAAEGELKIALSVKADVARGAAAFETCEGCHRKDASGRVSGAYPRLSGQHATVLMKQITDIRAGRRYNPKMLPFVEDHVVTPYDIADIAAHLQRLPIATDNGKGPGTRVARGEEIYARDCVDCHGSRGQGSAGRYVPMLAAQHYRYLLRELNFIRDGDRLNADSEMVKVMKPYSPDDLEALADYLARMAPPPPAR
jgi:cytochrome c553